MKKIILCCLTLLIVLGCGTIAFAANLDQNNTDQNGTFTAIIPEFVEAQTVGEQVDVNAYSVVADKIQVEEGKTLKATIEYDGVLREENGVEIPYKLVDENGDVASNTTILSQDGDDGITQVSYSFGAITTEKAKYAGLYTGKITFTFEVTDKTYTLEEIEEDPYMFAIGRTKPEYVVARFNEDFSEVTIFKNGEDSDGDMRSFSYEGQRNNNNIVSPMIEHADTLTSAIVEEGVTTIGGYAFYQCSNLQSVIFPSTLIEIGKGDTGKENDASDGYVFYECSKLQMPNFQNGLQKIEEYSFIDTSSMFGDLIIPNSVTEIEKAAFSGSGISSVTVSNGMKEISASTFSSCSNMVTVDIPNTITIIGNSAFYSCKALASLSLPEGLTEIGERAFASCTGLMSVEFPSSLQTLGERAFYQNNHCEEIYFPANCSVTVIPEDCFRLNNRLIEISLPDGLKEIQDNAFFATNNLTTKGQLLYILPDGLEIIGDYAFQGCFSIDNPSSINIPATVTSIGKNAFASSSLTHISVAAENEYYKDINGVLYSIDEQTLIQYPVGRTDASYTVPVDIVTVASYAFESDLSNGTGSTVNSALREVYLPNTVQTISEYAFANSYASINWPTELHDIGANAFSNNSGNMWSGRIDLPNKLESIGDYAFYDTGSPLGESMTVVIPKSVSHLETGSTFSRRTKSIIVDLDNQNYKDIDGVLFTKDGTIIICYPSLHAGEEYIVPDEVTIISTGAFHLGCQNAETKRIVLQSGVTTMETSAISFEPSPFLDSINLYIPASVTNINIHAISTTNANQRRVITIYGSTGSTIETWAIQNDLTFVPIEDTTEAATQSSDSTPSSMPTASPDQSMITTPVSTIGKEKEA